MTKHMSLGNHEFDEAVDGVIPFIRNLSSPVLAANLILNKVPDLEKESNLYKSIVITKNGVNIGIIGYLTPDTKFLAPKNDVEYDDEVISIRKEVKKLQEKGVQILIALGHSGFIKDLEIARDVAGIDLVIGGHSNTFLWNDDDFSEKPEYPQGPYPTIIQQASGRNVPVVQAYAYTKYMGKLLLTFDSDGEIVSFDGTPILLNQEVPEDGELLQTIGKYSKDSDRINNEIVGTSVVPLNGECRLRECNIGNLITDAIHDHIYQHTNGYSDPNIIIIQGGRIRASIDHSEMPIKTTRGDWISVLPYSDPLCIVTMNGTTLIQSLEHSVGGWREVDAPGQFLQISGIEVVYDLAKSQGFRVVSAKIACSNCARNEMVNVKPNDEYKVIMPIFLSEGGDGYGMFENLKREILVYNELDCVISYLKKYSPVNPELYGRITLLNEEKVKSIKDVIAEAHMKTEGRALSSRSPINYSKLYFIITSCTIIGIFTNSL